MRDTSWRLWKARFVWLFKMAVFLIVVATVIILIPPDYQRRLQDFGRTCVRTIRKLPFSDFIFGEDYKRSMKEYNQFK